MERPAPATDTSAVDAAPAWRMLGWLAAAELLGMSLWFSATAVTPSLVQAFHLRAGESAWLTMAVQGGFVIGTLVTAVANLADVFPAKRLMGAGCIAGAMANTAALLAVSPLTLIATRVLTGAALAWVYPPAMKLVAGWFRRHRGVALGVLVGALTLGKATPHLLTALFGGDWRTAMTFTSVLVTMFVPVPRISLVVAGSTLLLLAALGAFAAQLGGAPMARGAARVTFWGAVAMAATALVGRLFGAVV